MTEFARVSRDVVQGCVRREPTGPGRALPLAVRPPNPQPLPPRMPGGRGGLGRAWMSRVAPLGRRWGRRVAPDGGDRESPGGRFRRCPGPPSARRVTAWDVLDHAFLSLSSDSRWE